jgi:hypothetical protein
MYLLQREANASAATAALRHYAAQVTFFVEGVPNSSTPQLVVENRSGGTIRNIVLYLPIPVHGCSAHCNWQGDIYYRLPDIPPCSIAPTSVLSMIKSPTIGPAALAKSALFFTDQNGNAWDLFGYGRLVRQTFKGTGVFNWGSFANFKPADGCS